MSSHRLLVAALACALGLGAVGTSLWFSMEPEPPPAPDALEPQTLPPPVAVAPQTPPSPVALEPQTRPPPPASGKAMVLYLHEALPRTSFTPPG